MKLLKSQGEVYLLGGLQRKEIDVSGEVRSATRLAIRRLVVGAGQVWASLALFPPPLPHAGLFLLCQHLPTTTSRSLLYLSTPTPTPTPLLSAASSVLLWKAPGLEPLSRVWSLHRSTRSRRPRDSGRGSMTLG